MKDYSAWTKVVTHPLGLGGFAMFLVFVVLSKVVKRGRNQTITLLVFLSLAVVSLVGGLMIAWEQVKLSLETGQTTGSNVGGVEIINNKGDVRTGNIETNVNINTGQTTGSNVGGVEIKSNKGDVQTGNIHTDANTK